MSDILTTPEGDHECVTRGHEWGSGADAGAIAVGKVRHQVPAGAALGAATDFIAALGNRALVPPLFDRVEIGNR
mgnify:CR=1 FL=1